MLLGLALGACQHVAPAPLAPERSAAALEARRLDDPGLHDFLAAWQQPPPAQWPLPVWRLEELTLAALYFQPELAVGRARAAGADAATMTAAARPNPVLVVTPERSLNPGAAVSPWLAAGTIDWTIETAGKRGHRIEAARERAEAAQLALAAQAWQTRWTLRRALLEWDAAGQREHATAGLASAAAERASLLDGRLRAGAASLAEVTPARVARLQALAAHADARRQRQEARARLAAAIGVPAHALAGVTIAAPPDPDADRWLAVAPREARRIALHERPDLLAALHEYAAREAVLRLELARQVPDLHVAPGYQYDQGQDKWALGLVLELPILNRNQGPIAEAVAARREAEARFVALQASVLAEIERALAARRGARRQVLELAAVSAALEQAEARQDEAFAAGAVGRLALVDARLTAWQAQMALAAARLQLGQALADLEAAVQGAEGSTVTLPVTSGAPSPGGGS